MLDCINTGTATGEKIIHLVSGAVKNKLERAINRI